MKFFRKFYLILFLLTSFFILSFPANAGIDIVQWWDGIFNKPGVPTSINYFNNQNQNLTWHEKHIMKKYDKMLQDEVHHKLTRYEKKVLKLMKNDQPKDLEEYLARTKDIKNEVASVPDPILPSNKKLIDIPEPVYYLKKYNRYPGMVFFDITRLKTQKIAYSRGVGSPNFDKLVFTNAYYMPQVDYIASEAFEVTLDKSLNKKSRLKKANLKKINPAPIYKSGTEDYETFVAKVTNVLDYNKDGSKIALKEQISYRNDGIWQTNLIIHDFNTGQNVQLDTLKSAIKYWWITHEKIRLDDYRWDIFPIGWDELNPDKILVYAYAWTKDKPVFLGTWSADAKNERAELLSLYSQEFKVSTNGFILKSENE